VNKNTKHCRICNIEKPITDYNQSNNKDGHRSECKECQSEIYRTWYLNNAERQRNKTKVWRKENPEKVAEQKKRSYKKNPQAQHIRNKRWKESNPLKVQEQDLRRRARILNNGTYEVTVKELSKIKNSICLYCGSNKNITVEHVIPVSRGGTHSIGNLVPACGSCNYSKGAKTITEWKKAKNNPPSEPTH
jgi:5-methylcytosine-specific restriction endonuclease McrA